MTDIHTEFMIEKGEASKLQAEFKLAKECADLLQSHYPGHLWAVFINTEGGIAVIKNLIVSELYGYVIHLTNLLHDPKRLSVLKAGGEILERASLPRKWNGDLPKFVEGLPDKHQAVNGIIQ